MNVKGKQPDSFINKGNNPGRESKKFPARIGLLERLKTLKSEDVLEELAKPQVFEGPEITIQNKIVDALDKKINETYEGMANMLHNISCVGGIELTELAKDEDLASLIKKAKLVELKDRAVGKSTFNLVQAAGLEHDIVINTLSTMEKAGQLDYLRKSGLINEDWKIIIEVHYYRDRSTGESNKLHKDTLGQTLFVNLNYLNDKKMAGPEFIINPYSDPENQSRVQNKLPEKFVNDLQSVSDRSPNGNIIETADIMPNGVVAFVDEAIHHTTPFVKHRTVTAKQIAERYGDIKKANDELEKASDDLRKAGDELRKASDELETRNNNNRFVKFISSPFSRVEEDHERATGNSLNSTENHKKAAEKFLKLHDAAGWSTIMNAPEDSAYNRHDLKRLLPNLPDQEIDLLIEIGGYANFGTASIPRFSGSATVSKPVRAEAASPMQRQMSMRLTDNDSPPVAIEGEKRKFFRTWVRVVKK